MVPDTQECQTNNSSLWRPGEGLRTSPRLNGPPLHSPKLLPGWPADQADAVPDEIWDEATRHYNEQQLAAIVLMIALTNLFNRVNVTTRQVAGQMRYGSAGEATSSR